MEKLSSADHEANKTEIFLGKFFQKSKLRGIYLKTTMLNFLLHLVT